MHTGLKENLLSELIELKNLQLVIHFSWVKTHVGEVGRK